MSKFEGWLERTVLTLSFIVLAGGMVMMLAGCTTTPTAQEQTVPKSPREMLYSAYATLTAVRTTANNMFEGGTLSRDRLAAIDVELTKVRKDLDTAKSYLQGGSEGQAVIYIDAALAVLYRIQREVKNG